MAFVGEGKNYASERGRVDGRTRPDERQGLTIGLDSEGEGGGEGGRGRVVCFFFE